MVGYCTVFTRRRKIHNLKGPEVQTVQKLVPVAIQTCASSSLAGLSLYPKPSKTRHPSLIANLVDMLVWISFLLVLR
jgi:hypothetical protein